MTVLHPDPASLREKLREKIARELAGCEWIDDPTDGAQEPFVERNWRSYVEQADAVLAMLPSHLATAGWRVVPVDLLSEAHSLIVSACGSSIIAGNKLGNTAVAICERINTATKADPLAPADRTGEME
jgi:hypothetical protein